MDRKQWAAGSYERKVERFYGVGVQTYGNHHGGHLNFGLWTNGAGTYADAARNLVGFLTRKLGLDSESRLLDVGCGMGEAALFVIKTESPARIDAVDVTWVHVVHTRERIKAEGVEDRVAVRHESAIALSFPDESFTHVLSIEAPQHFDTREMFLREAHRVLKPGGVMVLADYTLKRRPKKLVERLLLDGALWLWKVPATNCYDQAAYRQKLQATGFTQVTLEDLGKDVVPGYCRAEWRLVGEAARARGWIAGYLGIVIDSAFSFLWSRGIVEYTIVRAEKSLR